MRNFIYWRQLCVGSLCGFNFCVCYKGNNYIYRWQQQQQPKRFDLIHYHWKTTIRQFQEQTNEKYIYMRNVANLLLNKKKLSIYLWE